MHSTEGNIEKNFLVSDIFQNTVHMQFTGTSLVEQSDCRVMYRSGHPEVLCKKCVYRNLAKFTGKHQCQILILIKFLA